MDVEPEDSMVKQDRITPRCHLLALPRELRDHIYSYLLSEELDWKCIHLFLLPAVQVRFHNTPELSLLHTHPRLRAEYLEAPKDVSVTIRMGVENGPFGPLNSAAPTLPVEMIFYYFVRHITILIDYGHARRQERSPDARHWEMLQSFVRVLVDHAPHLCNIRIGIQYHSYTRVYHFNHFDHIDPEFPTGSFLQQPPLCLGEFGLVQRGEGYRFDQAKIRALPLQPTNTPPRSLPLGSPHTRLVHGLVKNGAYLYVREDKKWRKRYWTKDEVTALFPVRPYSRGWGIDKDVPWLAKHEMREWRERRGKVEAKEWF